MSQTRTQHMGHASGAVASGIELSDVVLEVPFTRLLTNEFVLQRRSRFGRHTITFRLHGPLAERVQQLLVWGIAATPLILAVDEQGAVLHGPDGEFIGQVVNHQPHDRCVST